MEILPGLGKGGLSIYFFFLISLGVKSFFVDFFRGENKRLKETNPQHGSVLPSFQHGR